VAETTIEAFTRLGLPPDKVVDLIIEGMRATRQVTGVEEGLPDWQTRIAYIREYLKMTGGYAPEKRENLNSSVSLHLEMSKEEVVQELERMEA